MWNYCWRNYVTVLQDSGTTTRGNREMTWLTLFCQTCSIEIWRVFLESCRYWNGSRLLCPSRAPESARWVGNAEGCARACVACSLCRNSQALPVSKAQTFFSVSQGTQSAVLPQTAGRRLSWVTVSSIAPQRRRPEAGPWAEAGGDSSPPPLPLPIIWGALPWTGQASESSDSSDSGQPRPSLGPEGTVRAVRSCCGTLTKRHLLRRRRRRGAGWGPRRQGGRRGVG